MTADDATSLAIWMRQQARYSARAMEDAISATHLEKKRAVFGHTVRPAKGSVLASPVMANWDPEPDYFFHWLRDSALVMDAVSQLSAATQDLHLQNRYNTHFTDFVSFSLGLMTIDGEKFHRENDFFNKTHPDFRKYLRTEEDMALQKGQALGGEPRFNPDGTPDIQKWSRPQHDGPALRALCCLRHVETLASQNLGADDALKNLLLADLRYTLTYADAPCVGPWEEGIDNHYYTSVTQLGALWHGAKWARPEGLENLAQELQQAADAISANLDAHWLPAQGFYKSARNAAPENTTAENAAAENAAAENSEDLLDMAEIMGVLHARLPSGRHSLADERVRVTMTALETLFERLYPINRNRPAGQGLAMGRYRQDKYFSGGAYYFSTLAAAEFYYALALAHIMPAQAEPAQAQALIRQGDGIMETVRRFTPQDGALSEQFDKETGAQTSARHLTWSYAGFVTAWLARERAVSAVRGYAE